MSSGERKSKVLDGLARICCETCFRWLTEKSTWGYKLEDDYVVSIYASTRSRRSDMRPVRSVHAISVPKYLMRMMVEPLFLMDL